MHIDAKFVAVRFTEEILNLKHDRIKRWVESAVVVGISNHAVSGHDNSGLSSHIRRRPRISGWLSFLNPYPIADLEFVA